MDDCLIKDYFYERTDSVLDCEHCLFRGTDECQCEGGDAK